MTCVCRDVGIPRPVDKTLDRFRDVGLDGQAPGDEPTAGPSHPFPDLGASLQVVSERAHRDREGAFLAFGAKSGVEPIREARGGWFFEKPMDHPHECLVTLECRRVAGMAVIQKHQVEI